MAIDYQARMTQLLDTSQCEMVALVPGANLRYFTGLEYHLSERPLVAMIEREGLSFIMPQLEADRLHEHPDLNAQLFIWSDGEGYRGAFREAARELRLAGKSIGLDGLTMRVFEWLAFKKAGISSQDALDVSNTLLGIRSRKTPEEVESMRKAIAISEHALDRVLEQIKAGMTEIEIAAMLSAELTAGGSERPAFDPIVATGPRSALPHCTPGDRKLEENDIILFDFGAIVDGYPADITRTFCFGTPTEEMKEIHSIVRQANEAARDKAGPGVSCGEVDHAARAVIEEAGYGKLFRHRTGHGLGLEIHELPQIAPGNDKPLEPGMVFTIEPGIYILDGLGVRIEDDVLVTEDGVEVLTSYPRDLMLKR